MKQRWHWRTTRAAQKAIAELVVTHDLTHREFSG